MKIKFTQIISILNLCLFAYLSYSVYQQEMKARGNVAGLAQPVEPRNPVMDLGESVDGKTPSAVDHVAAVKAATTFDERLRNLQKISRPLSEAQHAGLMALVGKETEGIASDAVIHTYDLREKLLSLLINEGKSDEALMAFLLQQSKNPSLSLSLRQQSFRFMFIFSDVLTRNAKMPEEKAELLAKYEPVLLDAIETVLVSPDQGIAAIAFEGAVFLNKRHAEHWVFSNTKSYCLKVLNFEGSADSVQAAAFQAATHFHVDGLSTFAKALLTRPDIGSVPGMQIVQYLSRLQEDWDRSWLDAVSTGNADLQLAIMRLRASETS